MDPVTKLNLGLGERLTSRIYDWFRLPSLDGIPVYVRSANEPGRDRPAMPYRRPGDKCLEYIVPLVDAHLVRDPVWHAYLTDIAKACADSEREAAREWGLRMFPVALDSTAFNLPDGIARMNYIRHGLNAPRIVVTPGAPDEAEQRQKQTERENLEAEETLKHLTEALARDLNARLFPEQKAERFKIFISYARADSTAEAKALRNYIQGNTQCLAFFDESDIGFGSAFDESIAQNVGNHSKALIVLNSDHYAERPWCRWELDRFTRSRKLSLKSGRQTRGPGVHVFHPVLVVDNMAGSKLTRVVPELGQAPVVRWAPDRERVYFGTLMREVIIGLRNVLEARATDWQSLRGAVVVNRLPGPVALARLLPGGGGGTRRKPFTVHYPGHGLALTELRLLEKTFPKVRFQAFRDITQNLPREMESAVARLEADPTTPPPLREKVIALSTAHNHADLAALGLLPQHQDEALIHLLRPLLRLGADLLYGGRPPHRNLEAAAAADGMEERNITLTLLQLLGSERRVVEYDPEARQPRPLVSAPGPLLFNISAWPACARITAVDEAAWINLCRVYRVLPQDAGLPEWKDAVPGEHETPEAPGFRRHLALTSSRLRTLLAGGFRCQVPGKLDRHVHPAACVFMGGALGRFKGVMPGVFEEFLCAAQARPAIPIYLVGGLGGATGVIANALLNPTKEPPPTLTQAHYMRGPAPNEAEYNALLKELTDSEAAAVRQRYETLWATIQARHGGNGLESLFNNGLSDAENRKLLVTPNTIEAVSLIWRGLSRTLLADHGTAGPPIPPTTPPGAARKRSIRP